MSEIKTALLFSTALASMGLADDAAAQSGEKRLPQNFKHWELGAGYFQNGLFANGLKFTAEATAGYDGKVGQLFRARAGFRAGDDKIRVAQQFVTSNPYTGPRYVSINSTRQPFESFVGIEAGPLIRMGGNNNDLVVAPYIEGGLSSYPSPVIMFWNGNQYYGGGVRFFGGQGRPRDTIGFMLSAGVEKKTYNENVMNAYFGSSDIYEPGWTFKLGLSLAFNPKAFLK